MRKKALSGILLLALSLLCSESQGAVLRPSAALLRNWGLENTEYDSHIHAREAWKVTRGSRSVVVAVVDTGIDPQHRDLKNNLWHKPGTKEYGYDFVLDRPNPKDEDGHGTHVAGIIGAGISAGHGAAGVAPNIRIMAVRYHGKSLDSGQIISNLVKAIRYAVENNADIINISSEGKGFSAAEFRAIRQAGEKGILVVAAAGNQGENNDLEALASYPASYDLSNVLSVAATNIRNRLLPSSNFGRARVHVAAPGENIYSTLPGNRYGYLSGTSQAAAFAAGQAALVLSQRPGLNPEQVKEIIIGSVDQNEELKARVSSGGRINAFRAVSLAQSARGRAIAQEQPAP